MRVVRMLGPMLALISCLPVAHARGLQDFLDSVDLNDYALGLNFYASRSVYEGVDAFMVAFPVPTNYGHTALDDDPFFVRGSKVGLRRVLDNGWLYGGLLDIQSGGYGSNESEILVGMRRRSWTLHAGGLLGKRFGGFQVELTAGTDILNEHDGHDVALKLLLPIERERFYVVPQLIANHESAELVNHYYGVTPGEAAPGRPVYAPGAATTFGAAIDGAWRFHRRWYLNASIGIDVLPDEIRQSPIVDKNTNWRFLVGVAYDRDAWVSPHGGPSRSLAGIETGFGAYFVDSNSNVSLQSPTQSASPDLESLQGLDGRPVMIPVDVTWRIGRYHRLDLGYYQLKRDATNDLSADLTVGDVVFPAGEAVATDFDTRIVRIGYGFSFLRDEQKELTLFGGLHHTDIRYRVRGTAQGVSASTEALLPVVGLRFMASPHPRLWASVGLEIFRLDFDQHSGELIDLSLSGEYWFSEQLGLGAGFRYYRQDIESGDDSFLGDYRFEYRGPVVLLKARF